MADDGSAWFPAMNKGSRLQYEPTADRLAANAPLFGPDDPYVQFLQACKDRAIYLKPYNGNSGDLLIWLGTEYLLRDLHLVRTWTRERPI